MRGGFSSIEGAKTSSSSSLIEIAVSALTSSKEAEGSVRFPENKGAGGSGRFGLPPYLAEDGVPGRGLPFRSAGSYGVVVAGGRVRSDPPLDGVQGRPGELRVGEGGDEDLYGGAS